MSTKTDEQVARTLLGINISGLPRDLRHIPDLLRKLQAERDEARTERDELHAKLAFQIDMADQADVACTRMQTQLAECESSRQGWRNCALANDAEMKRSRAKLDSVIQKHRGARHDAECKVCRKPWPCTTYKLATENTDDDPTHCTCPTKDDDAPIRDHEQECNIAVGATLAEDRWKDTDDGN